MKRSAQKFALPLLALAAALGLGACSRAQHVTDHLAGPARAGAGEQVVAGCPTLIANDINTAFDFNVETGAVVQFRNGNRIRIETVGDAAEVSIQAAGPCAASDIPSINFIGGHANVFLSGTTTSITTSGNRLTFGALLFPGALLEPGVVVAQDAEGNVLEWVWPELAGVGIGSPIMRIQLAAWNTALVNGGTLLDVTWDVTAEQDGVLTTFKGHCEGMAMDGTPVIPGGASIVPCPATIAGTSGDVNVVLGDIVQFRRNRLRFEAIGDTPLGAIEATGACAASDAPTINYVGGSANVLQAGTNISVTSTRSALTFGPLLFPGVLLEPGVVVAQDNNRNVLEIIWPGLAGFAPGPPILRLQLRQWDNWLRTGRSIDVRMRFDARGADGATASYNVASNGIVVPQQR
jgi:hypothetical protein